MLVWWRIWDESCGKTKGGGDGNVNVGSHLIAPPNCKISNEKEDIFLVL